MVPRRPVHEAAVAQGLERHCQLRLLPPPEREAGQAVWLAGGSRRRGGSVAAAGPCAAAAAGRYRRGAVNQLEPTQGQVGLGIRRRNIGQRWPPGEP
jgi:hypothetical protein